jgi:protein-S-isoprenylcysteine O-methyltransferase Ste14
MNKTEQARGLNAWRRLLPPRGLMLSVLIQIPLVLWSWPLEPAGVPALMGVAMLVVGVALNVWAERLFRKSGVGVCPFSPVPGLVSEGPYRFTRNPMYLGLVLESASVPLITGLRLNLWAATALAAWLHFRFVLPEEQFLQERLGVAYLAYASRNPRWLGLPGPRAAHTGARATEQDG